MQVCLGAPVASVIMFDYPMIHETFMKARRYVVYPRAKDTSDVAVPADLWQQHLEARAKLLRQLEAIDGEQ